MINYIVDLVRAKSTFVVILHSGNKIGKVLIKSTMDLIEYSLITVFKVQIISAFTDWKSLHE